MNYRKLSILLLIFPFTLQAQVYRCETSQGTIYSQMPCAENAERLAEYEPPADPEINTTEDPAETGSASAESKQPTPMESFISTLEKQREEQFRTIDANIRNVQRQLNVTGAGAPGEEDRLLLENELAELSSERASIHEQYVALINEASNRAASGQGLN